MKTLQECKDQAAREWNLAFDYRAIRNGVQVGNIQMLHLDGVVNRAMELYAQQAEQSKWVDVKEHPQHSKDVLVATYEDGKEFYHVAQCHSGRWYTHSEELYYVTKWQEIIK